MCAMQQEGWPDWLRVSMRRDLLPCPQVQQIPSPKNSLRVERARPPAPAPSYFAPPAPPPSLLCSSPRQVLGPARLPVRLQGRRPRGPRRRKPCRRRRARRPHLTGPAPSTGARSPSSLPPRVRAPSADAAAGRREERTEPSAQRTPPRSRPSPARCLPLVPWPRTRKPAGPARSYYPPLYPPPLAPTSSPVPRIAAG